MFFDTKILKENEIKIAETNRNTLSMLTVICNGLLLVLFFVSPYIKGFEELRSIYLVYFCITACITPVLFLYAPRHLKIVHPLCYFSIILFHSFGIIAGVFLNTEHAAGSYFSFLYILPLLIIDNPKKIHIATITAAIVFCISTYCVKTEIDRNTDITNAVCNTILAVFVSTHVIGVKIREIDAGAKIIFQRDTDILTLLPNRRKLFETLAAAETPECKTPITGVLMIDIDLFKQFNDIYGHQAGDDCLHSLGACFAAIAADTSLEFFRYGGEEFAALSRNYTYEELAAFAQRTNDAVRNLHIPMADSPYREITVSIGYTHVSVCGKSGYQSLITAADTALYYAKSNGRNISCGSGNVPQEFIETHNFDPSFR